MRLTIGVTMKKPWNVGWHLCVRWNICWTRNCFLVEFQLKLRLFTSHVLYIHAQVHYNDQWSTVYILWCNLHTMRILQFTFSRIQYDATIGCTHQFNYWVLFLQRWQRVFSCSASTSDRFSTSRFSFIISRGMPTMLNTKNKLRSQAELNSLQQPRQFSVLRQQRLKILPETF